MNQDPHPEARAGEAPTDGSLSPGASDVDVPVLVIVFNRPEYTIRLLRRLREVRPTRLFVAADGPRPGREDDERRCAAVRALFDEIDWPCDVVRLFREQNLGCKRSVESALDWFFDQVEQGIILEDDCIPDPTFFPFADTLLRRFAADERIMMISGTNRLGRWQGEGHSYHFSRHGVIWGWATWRRAWALHDRTLSAWADDTVRAQVADALGPNLYRLRAKQFDVVHKGELDTWDYGWMFTVLRHGLVVSPEVNLITNIGFGPDATHTFNEFSSGANLQSQPMKFPLRHPEQIQADAAYDARVAELVRPRFAALQRALPGSLVRVGIRALSTIGRPLRRRTRAFG